MPDVALSDLQGLDNPSQMVAPSKEGTSVALSDMDKMGQSDPATYVPPPPKESILDRVKNDIVKPLAEAPQLVGQSAQWLGSTIKDINAPMMFTRGQPNNTITSSVDILANKITSAGLLLQENNKDWVAKNYPDAPPDILDRAMGGVPMLAETLGLASHIGLPAAFTVIAGQIGLQSAMATFSGLKEKGMDTGTANEIALPVGAVNGLAANMGFHLFKAEAVPTLSSFVKNSLNGMVGMFAQGITSGSLDLATGITPYNGVESFKNVVSEASLNAAAMGVLMGGFGHAVALKGHAAVEQAFQDIGMPLAKAKESANELMTQSAHQVMDWIQTKIDATPEQQARIMFLRPDAVDADREKFDRFVAGDFSQMDFQPTETKTADTEKLSAQVKELENNKQQIAQLNEVLAGKTKDEDLQKQILKEQNDIQKSVNTKHDEILNQHVQDITKQQKDMVDRQKNEKSALLGLHKENEKVLKKNPEDVQARENQNSLREESVKVNDKQIKERADLKQADTTKKAELEKARNTDLESSLKNLPTFQKVNNELNRLGAEKQSIQEKIDKLKDKLTSGPTKIESLKQEIRRLEQGFRKGRVATKDDIKSAQRQVSDLLKSSNLEAKDKAKFLDKIRQVDSSEKLHSLLPEIKNKIGILEQRAQQDKWAKDINNIKTKVIPKLLVKDQDILKPIIDSFDFSRRSRANILERKNVLEGFKKLLADPNSPKDANGAPLLPRAQQQILDMAAAKSFSEMDHQEIEAVYSTIMSAVHEARVAAGQDIFLKGENYRAYKQKALDYFKSSEFAAKLQRLEQLDNLQREGQKESKGWKERILDQQKALITEQKLPEILYDMLGQREMFQNLHEHYQTKTDEQRKRVVDLARIFWDVDIAKMYDPVEIKDLKYEGGIVNYSKEDGITGAKLLDVYANSFDEDSRLHLLSTFGEAKTNALVSWVEKNMSKEAKAAQRMFDYYRAVQGPRLDAAVVQHEGHHMNQIYYYNPTGNSLETRGARNVEEDAKFGTSGMIDRALPMSGFTKSRLGSQLEYEHFDYFDKIMKNLLDSENYINLFGSIKDANRLLFDPEYTSIIKDTLGQDYLNVLHKSLRDVAYDGHQYDGQSGNLMRYLRKNFVYAKIGWNAISAGKVLSQLSPASTYVDSNEVGVGKGGLWVQKALTDYMYNFKDLDKFIDANSLQMKNRYLTQERETVDMIASKGVSELMPAQFKEKYLKASMAMHQWVDRFVTRVTWLGAYNKVMAENEILGGNQAQALEAADRAVRRTHPMGQALYLPDIFRGNEWQKTITTFHNATNRNLNLQVESIEKNIKGEQEWYHTAGQFLGYTLLPALWISYMSLRRQPDLGEYSEEVLNQSVGSHMYYGLLTSAIIRHADAGAAYPAASAATDVAHLIERKDKLGPLAAISEDFSGVPVTNAGRMLTLKQFKPVKRRD